jgi:hypothetical protein
MSKARNLSKLVVDSTGDVDPASLGNVTVTPTAISDQVNTSTGAFDLPAGTTAERPSTTSEGYTRVNTTLNVLETYARGDWQSVKQFITVPGAPTIGTVTVAGLTATVPFTAPTNNGDSPITSYTCVTYPGGAMTSISQSGSGSFTITGLTNGQAYTFKVYATNAAGNGPLSAESNSITAVNPATAVDYLVVAGGGSATWGGGGAGGFRAGSSLSVTPGTTYTVTVGAGGSGGNGGDSVFSSITSIGGGRGGGINGNNPNSGGSGGGGGSTYYGGSSIYGASGTSGQGNGGGNGWGSSSTGDYAGGGGGGAGGGGGSNNGGSIGGSGGSGASSSITGSSVTYAGGGGSSGQNQGGNGGSGGGGWGGVSYGAQSTPGEANTGGGGGGDKSGGSGVVILRYPDTFGNATVTGNPTFTTTGGYKIYKFTSSGTIRF